jgi:amino acid permease
MPGKPESLYELGYMLMARKSIFLLSGTLVLNSLGLVMVYFIVFSETMKSVAMDAFSITENDEGFKHYLAGKQFWIMALGVLVLPVCLKKEL